MRSLERVKSNLDGLTIPVVETYSPPSSDKRIYIPTLENPQGPIFSQMELLAEQGKAIISDGNHSLYQIKSLVSHHKGLNSVYWVAEQAKDGKTILPWDMRDNTSWKKLARDRRFLNAVEEKARQEITDNSSFFFVYGWAPNNPNPLPNVSSRGAMSQVGAHFHHIGPHSPNEYDSTICLTAGQSPENVLKVSYFLDLCAQVALREFDTRFKKQGGGGFASHEHSWKQCDGKADRHAFGFLTLADAIHQLVELDESLKALWPKILPDLVRDYRNDYLFPFMGEKDKKNEIQPLSLLLLPPCVVASGFIPSPADKTLMDLPQEDTCIWVSPFSLADKKALVDGYLTQKMGR